MTCLHFEGRTLAACCEWTNGVGRPDQRLLLDPRKEVPCAGLQPWSWEQQSGSGYILEGRINGSKLS